MRIHGRSPSSKKHTRSATDWPSPFRELSLAACPLLRRCRSLGPGQRVRDVRPQLVPGLPFALGQPGQDVGPVEPEEVRVPQPAAQAAEAEPTGLLRVRRQPPALRRQLLPQPAQGQAAEAGPADGVEARPIPCPQPAWRAAQAAWKRWPVGGPGTRSGWAAKVAAYQRAAAAYRR